MDRAAVLLLLPIAVTAARGQSGGAGSTLSSGCTEPAAHYEGFTIRQVRITGPFSLPAAIRANLDRAGPDLPRAGDRWRQGAMGGAAKTVVEAVTSAPLPQMPFQITAVPVYIENCDPAARQLDVVAYVFGTRLFVPGLWSWESVQALREDARTASGMLANRYRLRAAPLLRYDKADSLVAGGRLLLDRAGAGPRLTAEGAGANRFADARIAASGDMTPERAWLWRLAYAAGFRFTDQPLAAADARQGYGFGWLSGATRPLPALGGAVRYALQYERGYQAAGAREAAGAAFLDSTRYSAVKLLAGASGGSGRHDYSLTAGFQLGSAGGITNAYGKTVLDGTYAVRLVPPGPLFDHRSIDLDVRGTGGWLGARNGGRIPVNERFFGGIRERRFSDLPDWHVASAPVIRSFPSNRLLAPATAGTEGRERYVSFQLTAAFTTYRLPLIPREVRQSPDFQNQIQAGKGTAFESLLSYHESKDPAMSRAESAAAELDPVLQSLLPAVDALVVPESLSEARDTCREAIEDSQSMLSGAMQSKAFAALLNTAAQGALLPLLEACGGELDPVNAPLRSALETVRGIRGRIEDVIRNRINHQLVERRAREDSRIALRALDAFQKEINLVSIDPLVVFDRAWIRSGPPMAPALVRYALGGGVRFTLASTISFQTGYAVNVNRGRGEPRGAVFVGLRFHDLIR